MSTIDVLDREMFINRMIDIIEKVAEKKNNCCFAIDGEWGSGKTFVLDMFKDRLKDIQSEITYDNKYYVFHYNCWKYDYYDEPLIAIISSMIDDVDEELSMFNSRVDAKVVDAWRVARSKLIEVANKLIENKIGINIGELYEEYKDNSEKRDLVKSEYDKLFTFKKTLEQSKNILGKLSEHKTIVIIVDELDRCLPEYSIKILERLHHLFDEISNVVIVISIDGKQMTHSIKQIFGQNTKVEQYLRKFINFRLVLDSGQEVNTDIIKLYKPFFSQFDIDCSSEEEITDFMYVYRIIWSDVNIRTQKKLLEKAFLIHNLIYEENNYPLEILLFELCIVRYQELFGKIDLGWLARISQDTSATDINILSSHIYDELCAVFESIKTSSEIYRWDGNLTMLEDSYIAKCFYILNELYTAKNKYCLKNEYSKKNIEFCKKFASFAAIMM